MNIYIIYIYYNLLVKILCNMKKKSLAKIALALPIFIFPRRRHHPCRLYTIVNFSSFDELFPTSARLKDRYIGDKFLDNFTNDFISSWNARYDKENHTFLIGAMSCEITIFVTSTLGNCCCRHQLLQEFLLTCTKILVSLLVYDGHIIYTTLKYLNLSYLFTYICIENNNHV